MHRMQHCGTCMYVCTASTAQRPDRETLPCLLLSNVPTLACVVEGGMSALARVQTMDGG
jgi:hypothetical protein